MVKYYTYVWHPGLFEKQCVFIQLASGLNVEKYVGK